MKTYWKIVEEQPSGELKTLFHGVNGIRILPKNRWLKAQLKWVTDGKGPEYLSGWHVLPSRRGAEDYLTRFKNRVAALRIIPCKARNLRQKLHSNSEVYLAEYIKLI